MLGTHAGAMLGSLIASVCTLLSYKCLRSLVHLRLHWVGFFLPFRDSKGRGQDLRRHQVWRLRVQTQVLTRFPSRPSLLSYWVGTVIHFLRYFSPLCSTMLSVDLRCARHVPEGWTHAEAAGFPAQVRNKKSNKKENSVGRGESERHK